MDSEETRLVSEGLGEGGCCMSGPFPLPWQGTLWIKVEPPRLQYNQIYSKQGPRVTHTFIEISSPREKAHDITLFVTLLGSSIQEHMHYKRDK